MYYGKKKKIIIIVVVLILLLAVLGVFGFLFLATDTFKSEQELFYKYMGQGVGTLKLEKNSQIVDYEKLKTQTPYTMEGSATASYEDIEKNTKNEALENLRIKLNGRVDEKNKEGEINLKLDNGTQTILEANGVKSNNILAFYSPEVITNYAGIRNEKLNEFFANIETTKNNSGMLPSTIQSVGFMSLLTVNDDEMQNIKTTYGTVIGQNIAKDKYKKQAGVAIKKNGKSYTANSYRLDLTGSEVNIIVSKLLQALKQDSVSLNMIATKAKALGLSSEYTEVNNLGKVIQNQIDNISTNLEKLSGGVSIIVYEVEGKTILTEVIIKNEVKISIDNTQKVNGQTLDIKLDNLTGDESYTSISLKITTTFTQSQTITEIIVNKDDVLQMNLSIQNEGTASLKSMKNTYNFTYTTEQGITSAEYVEDVTFVESIDKVTKLDASNCGIFNEYPKEQINSLVNAIVNRVKSVVTRKLDEIGIFKAENQKPVTEEDVNKGEGNSNTQDTNTTIGGNTTTNTDTNTTTNTTMNTTTGGNTTLPIIIENKVQ